MTPSSYVAGKPYCQCWTLLVFCVQNHLRSHPRSHLWYHCFLDWRRMCWLCVHKKPCDVLQGVFVSYKSWSFLNIRDSFRNLRKCRLQLQNSVNVMKQSRVEQRWLFMLQNVCADSDSFEGTNPVVQNYLFCLILWVIMVSKKQKLK